MDGIGNNKKWYIHCADQIDLNQDITTSTTISAFLKFNVDDMQLFLKIASGSGDVILNGYRAVIGPVYKLAVGDLIKFSDKTYEIQAKLKSKNPVAETTEKMSTKRPSAFDALMNKSKKSRMDENVENGSWELINNDKLLIFNSSDLKPHNKVAAFDMDGTLIKTKSGARFARDINDWEFFHSSVPVKLQACHQNGYKLVIFTNQGGLKTFDRIAQFKIKFANIVKALNCPVQLFVALSKTLYRKPITGMWDVLVQDKNNDVPVLLEESYYVGDAAGRPKTATRKIDHSICDRLFAINIGIDFKTPEEYFCGVPTEQFNMPAFDPRKLQPTPNSLIFPQDKVEMILMVGCPGAGKSHIACNLVVPNGYTYVNRDLLGTWQKCVTAVEASLTIKKSVVVDNTNPSKESRKRYIDLARAHNIEVRCFQMATTYEHCKHNNRYRELTDKVHRMIPDMVINGYKGQLEEPTLDEGFEEIVQVNFDIDWGKVKDLYKKFLLES